MLVGRPIESTVDAEVAKYYLEEYLSGRRLHRDWDRRFDKLHESLRRRIPQREELRKISEDFSSVDLAALVFGRQILRDERNSKVQKLFENNLNKVRVGKLDFSRKNILIVLVPGYDYVNNGNVTGADLAAPRQVIRDLQFPVSFVAIDPIGTVEENASSIVKVIKVNRDRDIIIAGPSSAGPSIMLAIGGDHHDNDVKHVKGWVNLSGVLNGVPALEWIDQGIRGIIFRMIVGMKGWRMASFDSMKPEISRKRFSRTELPEHLITINYIGLSLSGDISKFAMDKYKIMRSEGPNDGLTLLPDAIAPNSRTILALSSDHFFAEDPEIELKTAALLKTIVDLIP